MNKLQLPPKDMEKEKASLEYFIETDIDVRELKRAIAVRMVMVNKSYNEIREFLGVSNFFVDYWKKQFETKGVPGIKQKIYPRLVFGYISQNNVSIHNDRAPSYNRILPENYMSKILSNLEKYPGDVTRVVESDCQQIISLIARRETSGLNKMY